MFNSIRQYLSFSHHDGHNDEYIHQDNSWRQQKNHLIGNWLSDISQQAEEKESSRHFWNRRPRKKYYKNDLYNDELYHHQQQQQQQHHQQHQAQHLPQHQAQQHLPQQHLPQSQAPQHQLHQQPMFDRRRSHRSLSSLFRGDSASNLMHQHQPMFNGENSGHEYRRQRHHSLPSSYNGPHKMNKHQDSNNNYLNHSQQPYFPSSGGGIQPNRFSKHGDNDFSPSYYNQHVSMMNYNQEPMYSKSMQGYPQQQTYFNNPGSARELQQQQQQQMLYFQQQQQQQFPYNGMYGNRLAGNHNFYNNEMMTNNKMFR